METFSALLAFESTAVTGDSPHKDQWRGALMFSSICARTNGWVNNGDACDKRRHRAHYALIVMSYGFLRGSKSINVYLNVLCKLYDIYIGNMQWQPNLQQTSIWYRLSFSHTNCLYSKEYECNNHRLCYCSQATELRHIYCNCIC